MAYNLLDIKTALQDDLKDPGFSTARLGRYVNYAQNAIFNTFMFWFCEKSVTGSLTVGAYTFDQQLDWQVTIGGVLTHPTLPNKRFIMNLDSYLSPNDFFDAYPDPSTNPRNLPSNWTEYGDQVYFNCPVDVAYIFRQRYNRIPTQMTTDASVPEVPETFRELIEHYALYRSEKYRGNHDVAATYLQSYEDGLETMTIRENGKSFGARKVPNNGRVATYNDY